MPAAFVASVEKNLNATESIADVAGPASVDAIVRLFFNPEKAPSCGRQSAARVRTGGLWPRCNRCIDSCHASASLVRVSRVLGMPQRLRVRRHAAHAMRARALYTGSPASARKSADRVLAARCAALRVLWVRRRDAQLRCPRPRTAVSSQRAPRRTQEHPDG